VPRPRQSLLPAAPCLALLAALSAGCAEEPPRCPGRAEGTFQLLATRTDVSCAAGAPASAGGLDDLYPATFTLSATVAFATEGTGAAICTQRRLSAPLTGTHQGDQLAVALETGGAVLGECSATCAATVRQEIAGTLARDPGTGLVAGFTGTLVDRATAAAGVDCGPCTPPCQATYALALPPPAP